MVSIQYDAEVMNRLLSEPEVAISVSFLTDTELELLKEHLVTSGVYAQYMADNAASLLKGGSNG